MRAAPRYSWANAARCASSAQVARSAPIVGPFAARMRTSLNKILAHHTRQSLERIEKDVERDYIMTAPQSKEYGIIDEVISKRT